MMQKNIIQFGLEFVPSNGNAGREGVSKVDASLASPKSENGT